MIISSKAKSYARALFEIAEKEHRVDEILQEFCLLNDLLEQHPDLKAFLKMPFNKKQAEVLEPLLTKYFSPLFWNFFGLVLKNQRIALWQQIFESYKIYHHQFNHLMHVQVITAVPITEEIEFDLINKLSDYFNAQVIIENKLDRSIIGGIIIRANGEIFDASVLGHFNKLKIHLTKN